VDSVYFQQTKLFDKKRSKKSNVTDMAICHKGTPKGIPHEHNYGRSAFNH
jgi:hypothetical protein